MKTNKINSYLISANFAILLVFVFVFQSEYVNYQVRIIVLSAFILLLISLFCFIWYHFRYPLRKSILDSLNEKTLSAISSNIADVIEGLIVPLATATAREDVRKKYSLKLAQVKSEEELLLVKQEVSDEIHSLKKELKKVKKGESKSGPDNIVDNPAIRNVIESYLKNVEYETRDNFFTAFKRPLNEPHARIKHFADKTIFKVRIHIFVMGCILFAGAISLQTALG